MFEKNFQTDTNIIQLTQRKKIIHTFITYLNFFERSVQIVEFNI
jgi:hypothetical protein